VGEALYSTGLLISASDLIDPPANTPITKSLTVTYTPARELTVSVDGKVLPIKSSAATVGQALAEAGIPLLGLDYSSPPESEALPADGQIQVVRVSESVVLIQKAIPYENDSVENPQIELGIDQVLEPGEKGLSVSRVRIRYEDGKEISRQTESETVVRPPKKRVVAFGTKIVLKTVTIDGATIQYWRAISMYATSYSPCKSGVPGKCFSGTSLGLPVKKGVVAMDISMYNAIAGQQLFIPGYGYATVADVGGGSIIETNLGIPRTKWIDLGYSDSDWQEWGNWVTVYFLAPAPATIPYVLQ
jgi:3D (Asp-Asp-Asp) domain-containing protein